MDKIDWANTPLVPILDQDSKEVNDLIGAKVIAVGTIEDGAHLHIEGGLVIDYEKDSVQKRLALGYTELGMWTYWCGEKGKLNETDLLKEKIKAKIELIDAKLVCDNLRVIKHKDGGLAFKSKSSKTILELSSREIKIICRDIPGLLEMANEEITGFIGDWAEN